MGFPGGSDCKASACNVGDPGSIPGSGRSPGGGNGNPLQYSCLENVHGLRSLVGYCPWGRKELDMTEQLHFIYGICLCLTWLSMTISKSIHIAANGIILLFLWWIWTFLNLKCLFPYLRPLPGTHIHIHTLKKAAARAVFCFILFFKDFFLMWTIFKVFIEFATTLLLFSVLVFWPQAMWGPSSLTRDQTCIPCSGSWSLNSWTSREVPRVVFEVLTWQPPFGILLSVERTHRPPCGCVFTGR